MKIVYEETIRRLIKFTGSCCISCHEDAEEFGYSMIWLELGKDREAEVCCAVYIAFDEWEKNKCSK